MRASSEDLVDLEISPDISNIKPHAFIHDDSPHPRAAPHEINQHGDDRNDLAVADVLVDFRRNNAYTGKKKRRLGASTN